MKKKNIFLAIISMILLFQIPANAQKRWIGSISNDWSNGANWSPVSVPTASDAVIIENGNATPALQNVRLTANAVCFSIVSITNDFSIEVANFTLTVTTNITAGASFTPLLIMSPQSIVALSGNFSEIGRASCRERV